MSVPVFVASQPLSEPGQTTTLSGAEGRHAVTVMRLITGESILLIDGRGSWARAHITEIVAKDTLNASVEQTGDCAAPIPRVVVIQAIPKSERSELAVDLATQGGADDIIPWQAQRCIAKWQGSKQAKGIAKWEAAALAAAKQSRRLTIPTIGKVYSTAQVAELIAGQSAIVLHEDSAQPLAQLAPTFRGVDTLYLIIGPEGGIGEEELAQLTSAGAQPAVLGPEVLRTASASLAALAVLGALTDRWSQAQG